MPPAEPPPGDPGPDRFELGALSADLPPELALARLPVGRHGLPRSFVADNQRLRLVAAMLGVLPERGYPATTIGHLTRAAGVSRAAFYEQFESKEECFLATHDLAGQWLCGRVEESVAGEEEWSGRVRVGVARALDLLAANPAVAHLLAVEALQAGPAARERQQGFLACLSDALRAGSPGHPELPAGLEELLLGGALSLIRRYAEAGRAERLPEAAGELTRYLLIPYLGPGETGRVAAQAA